jgi:tetratricopeptide (TPR) repeat protein
LVSIEDLLKQIQAAETEEDRQWILLELQMSQMPNSLVSMLWAAAIPHFFDEKVLSALRPELAGDANRLYDDLKKLTFVEEFPGHGFNIHELTRNVLLERLWGQQQEEFLMLSQRAADYFFELKESAEEDVEFSYHEILNEGVRQTGRLLDRVINWWTYYQIDTIKAALQRFLEHARADRLSCFGQGFSLHLNGLAKSRIANYQEAESLFRQAKKVYMDENLGNRRYETTLLRDLSSSISDQGDPESARLITEEALKISEEQLGEIHLDTAISLNNLAGLYQNLGRYKEAEPLLLRALEINEVQLGENHLETAYNLNNLASLYRILGRYKEAEPLYLRALKIREEQLGENHPDTANGLNNLAGLYQNLGRYKEAEPLHLRALKIREEQLGENHPDTANSLNNLASLCQISGRYKEAEPLYLRALKIREEQLGENHPDTANSLNNLATLYQVLGRYKKAEPLYLRALKIKEEQLGENHPETANSLNNLAGLYRKQERFSEAIRLLGKWFSIQRKLQKTASTDYAEQTCTLGKLYEKNHQPREAVEAYEEAISVFRRLLHSKHPRLLILQGELRRLKKRIKNEAKRQKN